VERSYRTHCDEWRAAGDEAVEEEERRRCAEKKTKTTRRGPDRWTSEDNVRFVLRHNKMFKGKSLYHLLTYEGKRLHNPKPMKRSASPPELCKTGQITS
jgi:hypothetical protein